MKHREHSYRNGVMGRRLETRPGVGSPSATAFIQCSRCPHEGSLKLSVRMPPEQIDKKFTQAGWALDPHICPGCRTKANERKAMSAKPSPDAMRAQAQMFHLLQTHFDPNKGAFADGWDDARIAADTGLNVDFVIGYRETCFGKLKEPEEVQALRSDIAALEKLHQETSASFLSEITTLKQQLGAISAKWVF
ncbi:hypothetical protein [Sphingobium chungbukense]|uniref:Uncharacterized protein n=1 Tax=Sphingobium chungbukense TaxID=56193 RepID=A0A0M3AY94_9SPHN|nr:hypothetical protein [Sphingobium chungbukense]KKW93886.1 hypothetical protein YP76_04335 [Sphingobium chungbukense]